MINESRFPIIMDLRDTYIDITEEIKIYNNVSVLQEIPDPFTKVMITGYSEVDSEKTPQQNQYVVNYDTGIITFGGTIPNNTVVQAVYRGRGNILYPFDRIYTKDNNNNYVTLQSVFESASNGGVISVNGKSGSVTLIPADIGAVNKNGDTMTGGLTIDGAGINPKISGKVNSDSITTYPTGITVQYLNGTTETGFPSLYGELITVSNGASRNFQLFHTKDNKDLYIRTYSDTTGSWTSWDKILTESSLGMGIGSGFNADMVDGKHYSDIEDLFNSHANRTDNPHNVTASQVPITDTGDKFVATNVEGALAEAKGLLDSHLANTNNPHNVTAQQVPISDSGNYFTSTTVEAALQEEAQARIAHANRTDNPHNVTADQIPIKDTGNKFTATNVEDALSELNNKIATNLNEMYNVKDFNAKGDGVTDDTTAIQNAVNACSEAGGGIVFIPAGKYYISTTITIPSGVYIAGAGIDVTTIDQKDKQTVPAFATAVPTITQLVQANDVNIGDTTNTIANTAQSGDFIAYRSNLRFTSEWDGGSAIRSYYTSGEIFKVRSATSTSVTFTEPAHLSLPKANVTTVELFTPTRNIGVSNMTITRNIDTTSQSVSVYVRYCDHAIIQNVKSVNTNWAGIAVDRSMNVHIDNAYCIGGTYDLGLNYGVLVSDGSKNVYVSDLKTRYCRHGFSGGGSGYAIPINVVLNGAFITDTMQPPSFPSSQEHSLDTHGCTMNFTLTNVHTDWGMSISGIGHKVTNVTAVNGKFEMYEGGTDMVFQNIKYQKCWSFYSNYSILRVKFINVDIYLKDWAKNMFASGSSRIFFEKFRLINGNFRELPSTTTSANADATIPNASHRYGLYMRDYYTLKDAHIEGFVEGIYIDGANVVARDVLLRDTGWYSSLSPAEASILITKNGVNALVDSVSIENIKAGLDRGSSSATNVCTIRLYATGSGAAKLISISNVRNTPAHVYSNYRGKVGDSGFTEVMYLNCRVNNSGGGNVHNESAKYIYCSFHADN